MAKEKQPDQTEEELTPEEKQLLDDEWFEAEEDRDLDLLAKLDRRSVHLVRTYRAKLKNPTTSSQDGAKRKGRKAAVDWESKAREEQADTEKARSAVLERMRKRDEDLRKAEEKRKRLNSRDLTGSAAEDHPATGPEPFLRKTSGHPRAPRVAAFERALLGPLTNDEAAAVLNEDMQSASSLVRSQRPRLPADFDELDRVALEIGWLPDGPLTTTVSPELADVLGLGGRTPDDRLRRILLAAYRDTERVASLEAAENRDFSKARDRVDELDRITSTLRSGLFSDIEILRRRSGIDAGRIPELEKDLRHSIEALEGLAEEFRPVADRASAAGRSPKIARFYFVLRLAEAFILSTGTSVPKRISLRTEDASKMRKPDHPFVTLARRAIDLAGLGADSLSLDDVLRQIAESRPPGRKPRPVGQPDRQMTDEKWKAFDRLRHQLSIAKTNEEHRSAELAIAAFWAEEGERPPPDLDCAARLLELEAWTAKPPDQRARLTLEALPSYSLEMEMRGGS